MGLHQNKSTKSSYHTVYTDGHDQVEPWWSLLLALKWEHQWKLQMGLNIFAYCSSWFFCFLVFVENDALHTEDHRVYGDEAEGSMAAFGCLHIVKLNIKGGMRATSKPGNDLYFNSEIFVMPKANGYIIYIFNLHAFQISRFETYQEEKVGEVPKSIIEGARGVVQRKKEASMPSQYSICSFHPCMPFPSNSSKTT